MTKQWIVCLCGIILLAGPVCAGSVSVRLDTVPVTLQAADGFDRVTLEGYGFRNVPGEPGLPARIYGVALPPGAQATGVRVVHGTPQLCSDRARIRPSSGYRLISGESPEMQTAAQLEYQSNYDRIYSRDDVFPADAAEIVGQGGFRRYNIVDVRVTPFQYLPVSGRLMQLTDLEIIVDYEINRSTVCIEDYSPRMEARAERFIVNYRDARDWYPEMETGRGLHDFVIITTTALQSSVLEIVNWETTKGRTVEVVTVEWIGANYTGVDLAQKMRNFLREKYPTSEWGIEDVLFVGHHTDVPMRLVDQSAGSGYGNPRTDFYFAELSEADSDSWDSNNNGDFCDDSDNVDFYSEINVGRIPWSDMATVQSICEKSAAYESNDDPAFKQNMLLLGAFFWDDTDNAVMMEAKFDQAWMTDWTATRLYEDNSTVSTTYSYDMVLNRTNAVNTWSGGQYAFVNLAGHGSPTSTHTMGYSSAAFIATSDCSSLNDDYPAIIFADACSNSDTDETNLGMKMLQRGGVGFVGATKVAYGCPGWNDPTDGSSQSLDYYFTTGVTSLNATQGAAHQDALLQVYQINGWGDAKYEICEWNIWGNPDLGMESVTTSNGSVALDQAKYATGGPATVTVIDMDLNLNTGSVDNASVEFTTSRGDSETVQVMETGVNTGVFEGAISLADQAVVTGNGTLDVTHSDILTVHYIDADDGMGGTNIEKTDAAEVDLMGPDITNVLIADVDDSSVTIQWTTDEPADSAVYYGTASPTQTAGDTVYVTNHSVTLTGLTDCTAYVFYVVSADEAGNETVDDSSGAYYSVVTWELTEVFVEDMSSNPGWTCTGDWAWGQPTGQGGEYGGPDPVSGYTGSNVYGYNLNGDYPDNMPERTLTTPAYDCSGSSGVTLRFRRWLGVEKSEFDHAYVRVSNDGTTWNTIWSNPYDNPVEDSDWVYQEFDIAEYADAQSTVYIRWVMGSSDGGWTYCGWNIDDVKLCAVSPCDQPTPTPNPTNTPAPTSTPESTATPEVTATPTPSSETLVIDLGLSMTMFTGGDDFHLTCECINYGVPVQLNQFIILDVYGQYFFWPGWGQDLDYAPVNLTAGTTGVATVLRFQWPEGVQGSADGLRIWAALLHPDTATLAGQYDMVEFGYQ